MDRSKLHAQTWKPKTVDETLEMYRDWADTYEGDVISAGYATPGRAADDLLAALDGKTDAKILDFGCGTGLSGLALQAAGFTDICGTDISTDMLAQAEEKGIYQHVWPSQAGKLSFERGRFDAIFAAGVISLGAAPPQTLDLVLRGLKSDGLLVFSYNDPTLQDAAYMDKLNAILASGQVEKLSETYGSHLPEKAMNSKIYTLRVL